MSEEIDDEKIDLLYAELGRLLDYQANLTSNINERIGWLIVFAALNVSTLIVSSFTAFRSNLLALDGYEWWLELFVLDVLIYLFAITLGFLGQRIVIRYYDAGEYDELPYRALRSHDAVYIREWLLETRNTLFHQNERLVMKKTRYLNYAYSSLVAAVALLFVVVLTAVIL